MVCKGLRRRELGLTVAEVPPFAPTSPRETAVRRQLWKTIVAALRRLGKRPRHRRPTRPGHPLRFSDVRILEVYFFAAPHGLPIREACDERDWPICLRGKPLPDPSVMSRRMRTRSVLALLADLDSELVRASADGPLRLVSFMDGMPLRIAPHSRDAHAKFGHAGGVKAKGYKLHVLLRADGLIVDWRVTPLGGPEGCEKRMARRMLRSPGLAGYVVADGNYDANPLHAEADAAGLLLVSPKRKRNGKTTGFGHRRQRPGRRRKSCVADRPGGLGDGGVRGRVTVRPLGRGAVLRHAEGVARRPDAPAALGADLPEGETVRHRQARRPRPSNSGRGDRIMQFPRELRERFVAFPGFRPAPAAPSPSGARAPGSPGYAAAASGSPSTGAASPATPTTCKVGCEERSSRFPPPSPPGASSSISGRRTSSVARSARPRRAVAQLDAAAQREQRDRRQQRPGGGGVQFSRGGLLQHVRHRVMGGQPRAVRAGGGEGGVDVRDGRDLGERGAAGRRCGGGGSRCRRSVRASGTR